MGMSDHTVTGKVIDAFYYEDMKAIRATLSVPDGQELKIELPITMFSFSPDMDRDKEMRKTAVLMRGKNIKVISTAGSS